MGAYTAQQKFDAIMRELKYRARVYPRWVYAGKMSAAKADYEQQIFAEIAADYRARAQEERLI